MTTKQNDSPRAGHVFRLALLLCLVAPPAWAQTTPPGGIAPPSRPERPYRGLFGGGVGNTSQSLTLDGKVGGGFVENPYADQGLTAPPVGDPSTGGGASGVGSASLEYSMNRTKWGAHASYMSMIDYYAQVEQNNLVARHVATGTVFLMPSASTRIAFIQNFKNFPELSYSDLFDPELGPSIPIGQDLGITLERYVRYGTAVELTQRLSNRAQINADAGYAHGKVGDGREWVIVNGSATFSYYIAKGIGLNAGYHEGGQRDVVAGATRPPERQPRINAGVDLNRALSFSRRTTLSFSTGVAGVQNRALGETTYHLVGGTHLKREFGQTWVGGIGFNRSVRHIEPIGEALLTDTASMSFQGSFTRQLQFQAYGGYSQGRVGASGDKFKTQVGGVQLSMAISKQLALGADYSYYRYSTGLADLPLVAVGQMSTQSVRTYLQIWVPLMSRTKRP